MSPWVWKTILKTRFGVWVSGELIVLQAVPIYRRQDAGEPGPASLRTTRNDDSFARCFELLAAGEALLIFPEGQSHSDPSLRQLKTGAARLALGALQRNGEAPT